MQRGILRKRGGPHLRTPALASLVSVLAILSVFAACGPAPASATGFQVFLAAQWEPLNIICEDNSLNVTALPNDRFNLNENLSLTRSDMVRQLNERLKFRAEKLVYLRAGRDLFYQDFIRMVDAVYRPDEPIGLVTERLQRESGGNCLVLRGLLRKSTPQTTDPPIAEGLK